MDQKLFEQLMNLVQNTNKTKDIPVAAIIVDENDRIISTGWNTRNSQKDISAHAEINAINEAIERLNTLNLEGYKLITTLEPCQMCMGAIDQAHIEKVEFILDNAKVGINNVYSINDIKLNVKKISNKQQEKEYKSMIEIFFKTLR